MYKPAKGVTALGCAGPAAATEATVEGALASVEAAAAPIALARLLLPPWAALVAEWLDGSPAVVLGLADAMGGRGLADEPPTVGASM